MTTPTPRRPWRQTIARPRRPDVVPRADLELLAQVSIYKDVTLYTRRQGPLWRSYPVEPAGVAQALSRLPASSGLLPANTLATGHAHGRPFLVVYVPAHERTLRTEQREYTIPLPPLVWAGCAQDYRLFALAMESGCWPDERAPLHVGPFPNLYRDGRICWGSSDPRPDAGPATMAMVLDLFLEGSLFNLHLANDKSKKYRSSVLAQWEALARRAAKAYPVRDLVAVEKRLSWLIGGELWS
jgi:PRTRC genetic system protein B